MARVMISMPDELLEQIDAHARKQRTTRSGLLQQLADREMRARSEARRRRIAEILATAKPHGGNGAQLVREDRNRDNP